MDILIQGDTQLLQIMDTNKKVQREFWQAYYKFYEILLQTSFINL